MFTDKRNMVYLLFEYCTIVHAYTRSKRRAKHIKFNTTNDILVMFYCSKQLVASQL